jgi:heme-degrading monooxygenase HmoA
MMVIVFRARARAEALPELVESGKRMYEIASAMPGFISYKDFVAEDGEGVSIVEFDTPENLAAWRGHPEHRKVQDRAREALLSDFKVQVCRLERETVFPTPPR